jgi:multiple antibiotic resistance protein
MNTIVFLILSFYFSYFAVAVAIFIVLKAHYLAKILGASGIVAISRIVGFIVIAIEYNILLVLSLRL